MVTRSTCAFLNIWLSKIPYVVKPSEEPFEPHNLRELDVYVRKLMVFRTCTDVKCIPIFNGLVVPYSSEKPY